MTQELRHDPRLLNRIGDAISTRGYAGDVRPALLAYVAITSRLLERPMNLAFIAPSAAGKNRAVDAALELVPPEAVYVIRAASPKAAIYSDADFQHRTVFFSEADSIPEDGPAGSAIRSLAADNVLAYEVVEKDPKSGEFKTRRIEKSGPTGLITTSIKSLGTQMATRTLEVPLPDDAEQTRAVMRAHARSVNPTTSEKKVDLAQFVNLHEWLDKCGEHRVVVPFSDALAELVPNGAVRMRRDFKQLLTAIQTIALLHQSQRERTPKGTIATFEDYELARTLLAPVFEAVATEGLTHAIRETIEAIQPDERNVSQAELAKRLNLSSKGTVSWRVNRAIENGWLMNDEWRQGRPAKLRRGAALPEETTALPPVDSVRKAFESKQRSLSDSNSNSDKSGPEIEDAGAPFECSNEIADTPDSPLPLKTADRAKVVAYPIPRSPSGNPLDAKLLKLIRKESASGGIAQSTMHSRVRRARRCDVTWALKRLEKSGLVVPERRPSLNDCWWNPSSGAVRD